MRWEVGWEEKLGDVVTATPSRFLVLVGVSSVKSSFHQQCAFSGSNLPCRNEPG